MPNDAVGLLGYPDQAVVRIDDTLTLAKELSHPFSLARGLHYAAVVAQFRREGQSTHEWAESTMTLATEQDLVQWLAGASLMQGWALAVQGQHDKRQAQLCRGLAAWRATGAEVMQPYYLTLLADLHRIGGQANEGLSLVAEALTLVEKNRERLWEAEIHRLKGELLLSLSSDNYTAAESCFQKVLEIARHQQAKSLKLRTATSLAKLWQSQGKREESRELLEPVYSWFAEGFDTADLIDAKALLDELS